MENPYTPPTCDASKPFARGCVQTGLATFTGFLSLMMLVAIVSSHLTLARLPTGPTATWQWVGIIAMTIVILTTSIAFALVSIGLMRSKSSTWKRGLWILLGSVLAYTVITATAVIIRSSA